MAVVLKSISAHNLNPAPQEIDVHRLNTDEALVQVKKAIRDARGFGATQLRIIVGKGKHSKDNVPVLKPAVISELQKCVMRFIRFNCRSCFC